MHVPGQVVSRQQAGNSNQERLASKTAPLVHAHEEYSTASDKTELFLNTTYGRRAEAEKGNEAFCWFHNQEI